MADISDIIDELNDHGFEDTANSRKVSIINDTIADICSREAWPFLEDELALTFDGSTASPSNWPADFSKLIGIHSPDTGDSLDWERWEVVRKQHATMLTQEGTPELFYFVRGVLKLWPIPDSASTTLNMEYLVWHPDVTENSVAADILIPSRHHRTLVLGSLYKLYAMEDDPELSALFQKQYEERIQMMREDLIRVQYDTPDSILVFEDDYDSYL